MLPDRDEPIYYIYGSTNRGLSPSDTRKEVVVYRTRDLEDWGEPITAWAVPAGHWARETVWAPEVHRDRSRHWAGVRKPLPTPHGRPPNVKRNLRFFLRRGFDVRAVDADPDAIRSVRQLAASLQPALPPARIHCGSLDALPWEDGSTDAVTCSAVLHFARDERDFASMLEEMWRVLAPGVFFARLATRRTDLIATGPRARAPRSS